MEGDNFKIIGISIFSEVLLYDSTTDEVIEIPVRKCFSVHRFERYSHGWRALSVKHVDISLCTQKYNGHNFLDTNSKVILTFAMLEVRVHECHLLTLHRDKVKWAAPAWIGALMSNSITLNIRA